MLNHQRDEFGFTEVALGQTQFTVDRLARSKKLTRSDLHLPDQFRQLLPGERLDVVVNLLEIHATLTEQPIQLAAFRSGRFLVNDNRVLRHLVFLRYLIVFGLWSWVLGLG